MRSFTMLKKISVVGDARRLQAWIYLLDSHGMIVNQVQVSWPKVKKIYFEAKDKVKKE